MENIKLNFLKSIYSDDILYHYTKASTAIDYILYNNQLKFNAALNSSDPVESSKADRAILYSNVDKEISHEKLKEGNELARYLDELHDNFYMICFCKNKKNSSFSINKFNGNEELFGFTKPRMWDQYADKYSGVCIAFSKKKILSKNENLFQLITGNVKYKSFQDIYHLKYDDIQGDYLEQVGLPKYKKQLKKMIQKSFFLKHKDYSGENEFRIVTEYDKSKSEYEFVRGQFKAEGPMMLDVSDCIEAIFMSSYVNNKQKKDLYEYSKNNNIELIEMRWKHNSISLLDYKDDMKTLELFFYEK